MENVSVPEGFYVDPARPTFERWWTGTEWTDEFRPKSASASFWAADPEPVVAPPFPPRPIEYPTPAPEQSQNQQGPQFTEAQQVVNSLFRSTLSVAVPSRRMGNLVNDTFFPNPKKPE